MLGVWSTVWEWCSRSTSQAAIHGNRVCRWASDNARCSLNSVTPRKARLLCTNVHTRHTTPIPEKKNYIQLGHTKKGQVTLYKCTQETHNGSGQRKHYAQLGHPQKGQVTLYKYTHETQNANTREKTTFNSVTRRKVRLLCINVLMRHTTPIVQNTTCFNSITRRKARLLCLYMYTQDTTPVPDITLHATRSTTERPGYSE